MQKLLHLRRQISAYQVSSLKVVWMCTYNQRLIQLSWSAWRQAVVQQLAVQSRNIRVFDRVKG